ncbi:TonB-dependent receptor [bacterium]|nr:TonB-dependent receptor [bacterium]
MPSTACRLVISTLIVLVVCPAPARAGQTSAPNDTLATRVPDLRVSAPGAPWGDTVLDGDELRDRAGHNVAENLAGLPGVAVVRRAAGAAEPVIRGLGWERVQTVLGAVPLYGACPGRMDPPAAYLTPAAAEDVAIFRRGGGNGLFAGATGGAIVARPDYRRRAGEGTGTDPWLEAGYESAREAWQVGGGLRGRADALDTKFAAGHTTADDYTAPDGRVVPAGATATTFAGSVAWLPRDGRRFWYAGTYVRETDVDFPSLPMDNVATDFRAHNLGWLETRDAGSLRRWELTAGFSAIDHLMDNALKSNRAMMRAATAADTRTFGAHANLELAPGEHWTLRTGLDASRLGRDATRTREMLMGPLADNTYVDRSWPDAVQFAGGAHLALTRNLADGLELELAGRGDVVDSRARAADAASLGGLTVREQYVRFYGADAADTDRTETLGQADLALRGAFGAAGANRWQVRTGVSSRAAGITERYYAFGPAPGGYQIGDPTLAAEKKWEIEGGVTLGSDRFTVAANVFHARVGDSILPTVVDRRDVNGDTVPDVIKGFVNVDAVLTGSEVGAEWRPTARIFVPITVSVVRGQNTTDDRALPEIPPLFGAAEVRWQALPGADTWLRAGCTFAADQDRIDPLFGEDATAGWAVWHVGLESRPRAGWRFVLRVDNLFDRLYNDHLTREAVLATDDLAAGDEVPAPGRSVTLSARLEF